MARVTVEDCLERVENRFSLVHLSAQRAKQLKKGKRALIQCDNREIVTSLREIAKGVVHAAPRTNGEDLGAPLGNSVVDLAGDGAEGTDKTPTEKSNG